MEAAARDFEAAFTIAGLETLRAQDWFRIPGDGRTETLSDQRIAARERVLRCLDAVGGVGSPGGSILWYIVGMGESLRHWAAAQGWCGKSASQNVASGILIGTLAVLARHLGRDSRSAQYGLASAERCRPEAP